MDSLKDKRILLGVTGGIAAYKSVELVRRLTELGAEVRVVMTQAAQQFVGALTFQAVSGHPVRDSLLDPAAEAGMGHIELARWADLVLIAPASADCLAHLAHGFAHDLLTTVCLATQAPLAVAPAMNQQMWQHPATQANVAVLQQRGVVIWGPAAGEQACGEVGPGRMLEPMQLRDQVQQLLVPVHSGLRVMITAGPTQEALDPVRFITNRSSGKMGFALASAARALGAEVTLVAGPVNLPTPAGVTRRDVTSAQSMYDAVHQQVAACDIFIATAAVADFRPVQNAEHKIKKTPGQTDMTVTLVANPDIVASVAALTQARPFVVGFAAETRQVAEYAQGKLRNKNLDMIAANHVGDGQGFNLDHNALQVFWPGGEHSLPSTSKAQLAQQLMQLIVERYEARSTN